MKTVVKKRNYKGLVKRVSLLIEEARRKTVRHINTIITQTYWEIGRLIVKEEQKGKRRAKYGEQLLLKLSNDLAKKFGKGFSERNLRNMRGFYLSFPIRQTTSAKSLREQKFQRGDPVGSGQNLEFRIFTIAVFSTRCKFFLLIFLSKQFSI